MFWLDGPVSLTTGDFGPLLEQVKETGGGLTLASTGHSNFAATHSDMYKYLPSDSQALRQQRQGTTTMVLYRTEAIVTQVLQWLVLCSLRKDCIAPTKGRPCLKGAPYWISLAARMSIIWGGGGGGWGVAAVRSL